MFLDHGRLLLVDVKEATEEAIVLLAELLHLAVASVGVTLRPKYFLFKVILTWSIVYQVLHLGEMPRMIGVILISK